MWFHRRKKVNMHRDFHDEAGAKSHVHGTIHHDDDDNDDDDDYYDGCYFHYCYHWIEI